MKITKIHKLANVPSGIAPAKHISSKAETRWIPIENNYSSINAAQPSVQANWHMPLNGEVGIIRYLLPTRRPAEVIRERDISLKIKTPILYLSLKEKEKTSWKKYFEPLNIQTLGISSKLIEC